MIAILAITNMEAQQQVPRLVVYITVEQLRGDYIEYFYNTFGERGFKRLFNEGVVYSNVRFDFSNVEEGTAFATLFTGSNPCYHGISGNYVYNFEDEKEVSILYDRDFLGNYTKDNYSPKHLFSSTVGDELKIASKGQSSVYSIAPNPLAAILSAGHAANGAFWIDDKNGKWATTTYYKDMPWYVDRYNNGPESLSARLDSMIWSPLLPLERYNALPYVLDEIPFQHVFDKRSDSCYPELKSSPFVNKEINRLALQFIEHGMLGTKDYPDILAVTYYAGNFSKLMNKEYSYEIQDLYCQLDRDLEQLFDGIDKKVGLSQTLIVFCGSGYYKSEEDYSEGLSLNNGEFHPKRCVALLNMYLMALYGQQTNWVTGYYNHQIFLNRKAIEDAKMDLAAVQVKAANFVQEFAGVQSVTTNTQLLLGDWNERTAEFRNGTHHLNRGDLIVTLQPGWRVIQDEKSKNVQLVRNNAVLTPLVFFGNGLSPQRIYREVKATEIAPSVTHVLRIRPPNASKEMPLKELTGR